MRKQNITEAMLLYMFPKSLEPTDEPAFIFGKGVDFYHNICETSCAQKFFVCLKKIIFFIVENLSSPNKRSGFLYASCSFGPSEMVEFYQTAKDIWYASYSLSGKALGADSPDGLMLSKLKGGVAFAFSTSDSI